MVQTYDELPLSSPARNGRIYGRTEQTNVKFHRLKESAVKTSKQAFFDAIWASFMAHEK